MRSWLFTVVVIVAGAALFAVSRFIQNDYFFFAGYVVLQYIVLSTAWNILGGYCGYVNFGTAALFAIGAYTSVTIHKLLVTSRIYPVSIPELIIIAGVVSAIVGLGIGYLTLRLRGAYVIRPQTAPLVGSYIQYLFLVMLVLAVLSIAVARLIERSRLGYGFATIRDDEIAAEASGVPTLRLKLIATTLSGALMGMAGAPLPYYVGYLDPASGFNLAYAVNSIAMPVIGGTTTWIGPLIGAVLLGTLQQWVTVTISSAVSLLIVGLLLVGFVIVAPNGLVGLMRPLFERRHR